MATLGVDPVKSEANMENKLTLLAVIWLSGVVAGGILVARWLRIGEVQSAATPTPPIAQRPAPRPRNKVQRAAHRFAGPVAAGAKADLLRVSNATRTVTDRVRPQPA
jgi:hypothetical protein